MKYILESLKQDWPLASIVVAWGLSFLFGDKQEIVYNSYLLAMIALMILRITIRYCKKRKDK